MARVFSPDLETMKMQRQDEMMRRQAVASGMVDENSAEYRHAKLNGWQLPEDDMSGKAGRKWIAAEQAARGRLLDSKVNGDTDKPGISWFSANTDTGYFNSSDPNAKLRAGFDGLEEQADIEAADNKRRKQATLSWAYGNAIRNGGNVRKEVMPAIRRELGRNDLLGATVANDGNMMLIGQGKDGRPYPMGIVPAEDVLSAAMGSEDYDTADIVGGKLSKRLTPGQLQSLGWSKQITLNARQRKASDNIKLEALKILAEMDKNNGRPVDATSFYSKNPKLAEMFSQDYQRDSSGNIVKDPETGENVVVTLPPEEAAKGALAFFNGLRSSQSQDNGASSIQNAVVSAITQMLNPQTPTPTSQRRQTLYYYRNKSGGLTATNGFVVNGRAYDPYGNELRGVTPLDREGSPMTGEAPNDAVVQTQSQSDAAAEIEARKGNGTWGASGDKKIKEPAPASAQPQASTTPRSPESNAQATTSYNPPSPDDLSGVNHLVKLMNNNNNPKKGNAAKGNVAEKERRLANGKSVMQDELYNQFLQDQYSQKNLQQRIENLRNEIRIEEEAEGKRLGLSKEQVERKIKERISLAEKYVYAGQGLVDAYNDRNAEDKQRIEEQRKRKSVVKTNTPLDYIFN
jgi:hypothetical protein